jgi:hypothetical protein
MRFNMGGVTTLACFPGTVVFSLVDGCDGASASMTRLRALFAVVFVGWLGIARR